MKELSPYYEETNDGYRRLTYKEVVEDLQKEIERLKEMKLHTEKYASEMEDKYILEKSKNDKAIEYIEEKVGNEIHDMMYVIDVSDLLDILKGDDKE